MQRLLVTIPMSARVYAHQFKYFLQMILRGKPDKIHARTHRHEKDEKQENQDIAQMRKHRKRRDNGNDDNDNVDDEDMGADQSL